MNITRLVTGPLSVNTFFIPFDGQRMVVVDPGGDPESIIAHLRGLHSSVALILLTHGHFDHMIALPPLALSFPDADIAIHGEDSPFLGEGALARHHAFFAELGASMLIKRFTEQLPPASLILEEGKPITLSDSQVFNDWTVLHTPGHSPGSICLYNEKEKILISGDTLFSSGFGRTDADGGSLADLEKSISRLFSLPGDVTVLPGHGDFTTIARERVY